LHGVVSVGGYGQQCLRRGVHWLKFKGVTDVADVLARLLVPRLLLIAPLEVLEAEAAIVPVPLHKRRWRARGYNQSDKLAEALSKFTGVPIRKPINRVRVTMTQTKLPPEMRGKNLAGAFAVAETKPLAKKYYLVLDDVTTTGATLSAVGELLPGKNIWGVTVARG